MARSSATTSLLRWPATATVLIWLNRRSPCASCARRASCTTSSVPRRLTFRQLFSDLRLSEAAACSTESVDAARAWYSLASRPKLRRREIAAKNPYVRAQDFAKRGKIEVQLQRLPQTSLGFSVRPSPAPAGSATRRVAPRSRGQVGADIAGRAGQEDGHVARVLGTTAA